MRVSLGRWCHPLVPSSLTTLVSKLTDVATPVDELVSSSNDLVTALKRNPLPRAQAARIVSSLASRGIRHEPILERCFWSIYKSPFPEKRADGQRQVIAEDTVTAFSVMTQNGFVNDSQLLTIGLGRCIECTPFLSVRGISTAYQGIAALQRDFFSLTEVGLQDSNGKADQTLRDTLTELDATDLSALTHQPNLIDIACSALEGQMAYLAGQWSHTRSSEPLDSPESLAWFSEWVSILRSTSNVGLTSIEPLKTFTSVLSRWPDHPMTSNVIADALVASLDLHERVIDVLDHEESAHFADARESLASQLVSSLYQATLDDRSLQRDPALVLRIRHLFESEPRLHDKAPLLWDRVRTVKVSHRDAAATRSHPSASSIRKLGGKLSSKEFAVKVKRVTTDLSDAERFVPPEFKTWRSPQHTPRGGHQQRKGAPRKTGFGTRRISKNYLRDRRRRYTRA